MIFQSPLDALRYHVTGAIERGEKMPIYAVTKVENLDALIDLKLCTGKNSGDTKTCG